MHFPWKRSKVARIARLVAGGSLVVETGCPTSLVDLFIKSSDRLRKSSKRKCSSRPRPRPSPRFLAPLAQSSCNEDLQSADMDNGEIVYISRENKNHEAFKVVLAVAVAVSPGSPAIWILIAALLLVLIKFAGIPKGLKSRADELVVKQQGATKLIELGSGKQTCKSERSRSSRIKTSFIQKFVPKKLRHGKGVGNKDREASTTSSSNGLEKEKEKEKQKEREKQEARTFDQHRKGGNSGYVILTVLLAGLVGGRGVALVCCFLLVYIGTHAKEEMIGKET